MTSQILDHVVLPRVSGIALVTGAMLLAVEPLRWLVGTWHQQGYDGIGWLAAAIAAGAGVWSATSPLRAGFETRSAGIAGTVALLAATAAIRLASQLLDVNVVGALLLSVDVFALARLARLRERTRAVAPFWLAALFSFSLPVEPMLQRVFGYVLQQISAAFACGMLAPFHRTLQCDGVRLTVDDTDVLVDVPCSGAELVSTAGMIFSLLCTFRRPTRLAGVMGSLAALAIAVTANALRISLLALGIVRHDVLPFSVMDPLPHTLIGLVAVAVATLALAALAHRLPTQPLTHRSQALAPFRAAIPLPPRSTMQFIGASAFLLFALVVGRLEPRPVDASVPLAVPAIPRQAAGFVAQRLPLTDQERVYFTRFGGAAERAGYGPFALLLVSTASPLRHLHDPAVCLSGLGYEVRLLGTDHRTRSTLYAAERPGSDAGSIERFTLHVSYLGSDGALATNIAEVVWLWLRNPQTRWTMVQRALPDTATDPASAAAATEWELAMRRAFNLS